MIPSPERLEQLIEQEVDKRIEHTINTQPELQQFFMDNLNVVEQLAQLIVLHHKTPQKMGCLIGQQLMLSLEEEIKYEVKNEYES